jgi:hypothetical protein
MENKIANEAMAALLTNNPAPSGADVAATWTRADKDAVGTARSSAWREISSVTPMIRWS